MPTNLPLAHAELLAWDFSDSACGAQSTWTLVHAPDGERIAMAEVSGARNGDRLLAAAWTRDDDSHESQVVCNGCGRWVVPLHARGKWTAAHEVSARAIASQTDVCVVVCVTVPK